MFHGTRPGWIEVISGVMFSGKSEELIRRVRRAAIARKRVQVFKSHLDARYAGLYNVASHDGVMVEAEPVDSAGQILRRTHPATEGGLRIKGRCSKGREARCGRREASRPPPSRIPHHASRPC